MQQAVFSGTRAHSKSYLLMQQSSFSWYSGQAKEVGTKLPGQENVHPTRSSWKHLENNFP